MKIKLDKKKRKKLKNAYVGFFSICGEISVTNDATFKANVDIYGNSVIKSDNRIDGNLYVGKNAVIDKNLSVKKILL